MTMKLFSLFFFISSIVFAGSSSRPKQEPPMTVESVDLQKYSGKWFEIARLPNKFQKNCFNTTAEYSLREDGNINVVNTCFETDGKKRQSKGKAWSVSAPNNSKLKVQFFWPFDGDYWIIGLGEDYQWALVGSPDYEYLWVLSRENPIDSKLLQSLINLASEKGYDTTKLIYDPNLKLR